MEEKMINLNDYRLSRFNISTHDKYGNLLVTNALSNRLFKINNKSSQADLHELTMDLISRMQQNDIEKMIEGGIIFR